MKRFARRQDAFYQLVVGFADYVFASLESECFEEVVVDRGKFARVTLGKDECARIEYRFAERFDSFGFGQRAKVRRRLSRTFVRVRSRTRETRRRARDDAKSSLSSLVRGENRERCGSRRHVVFVCVLD